MINHRLNEPRSERNQNTRLHTACACKVRSSVTTIFKLRTGRFALRATIQPTSRRSGRMVANPDITPVLG
jgi:hypothetical protein